MMAIFADMVEKCIEVFMDDFSVFGSSFDCCLANLELVLQRCEETNLVLNWEKCPSQLHGPRRDHFGEQDFCEGNQGG